MPIVRDSTFNETLKILAGKPHYAIDTETTGLRAYLGDRLFSIIIATDSGSYYFNFKNYDGLDSEWVLSRERDMPRLNEILSNQNSTWFIHNAKFDLAMLAKEGLDIQGRVHCTEAIARILYNRHFDYTLAQCAKRIGLEKSKAVDEYISKNKLFTMIVSDSGKKDKQPHFDQVPFSIITAYGMKDGEITYKLGMHQLQELEKINKSTPSNFPSLAVVYENELALTRTCFEVETAGIKIDRAYSRRAFDFETGRALEARTKFEALSGTEFVDSANVLALAFDAVGEKYPRTKPTPSRPNGTPSFTDEVLDGFTTPLATYLREYRKASKKANTYYGNFLRYADVNDRIHANMRQAGTDTGRFSYSEPNLQNLSKEEDVSQKYIIRRAFIPTSPDFCFVMIDYDQMEYRLMLDYVNEVDIIRRILEEGLDVHQATANQMGVSRTDAKTLNFMLLYGGGVDKLAESLGITSYAAKLLKAEYFSKLPRVEHWTRLVRNKAQSEKLLRNWFGRRYEFPFINNEVGNLAYASPNHVIQGGCADIVRIDMNRCVEFLRDMISRLLVQVHDELLFEVHRTELHIVPKLVAIMESSYPHKHLPLTCGVSHSWNSWGDKVKGLPI